MWQIDRVGHPASMEGNPLGGDPRRTLWWVGGPAGYISG